MKKTIVAIITSVLLTLIVILTLFEIKAQRDQLKADAVEEIDSQILGEKRKLLIHLPRSYDANISKEYPVLYALDATSHDRQILNAANVLSAVDLFPEIIIVGIVNNDRKKDLTPDYIMKTDEPSELGEGHKFLDFLQMEVIPLISNQYRTTDYRMISGNSRGGLFAFYAMLEKPNLFDAHFCYSPAFWRNENIIVQKSKEFWKTNNRMADFIYMSLGSQENDKMKSGFNSMKLIMNNHDLSRTKSVIEYTENANHASNAYYSIPSALMSWYENR